MSYHMWTVDGYGVYVPSVNASDLVKFIRQSPRVAADFQDFLGNDVAIDDAELGDFEEYGDACECCGVAGVIVAVMHDLYGIWFDAVIDINGDSYVVYAPRYPWFITKEDLSLDINKLHDMFAEQAGVLCVQWNPDYHTIQCGG